MTWYWFLWLLAKLGLSGTLTVWSLCELAVAIFAMLVVLAQTLPVLFLIWRDAGREVEEHERLFGRKGK